jgi:hypothetical protein
MVNYMSQQNLIARITAYWDEHIHDLAITTHPVGSSGFFRQLDDYRYDKLNYLPRLVDFRLIGEKVCWKLVAAQALTWCASPAQEPLSRVLTCPRPPLTWLVKTSSKTD